jgi:hypothetical protein
VSRKRAAALAVPAALITAAAVWWWLKTVPNRRSIEEISDGVV